MWMRSRTFQRQIVAYLNSYTTLLGEWTERRRSIKCYEIKQIKKNENNGCWRRSNAYRWQKCRAERTRCMKLINVENSLRTRRSPSEWWTASAHLNVFDVDVFALLRGCAAQSIFENDTKSLRRFAIFSTYSNWINITISLAISYTPTDLHTHKEDWNLFDTV